MTNNPDMSNEDPEALFAAWAVRVEAGEELSFETLLHAHASQAVELRRLHGDWKLFAPLLGRVVPGLLASSEQMSIPPLSSADEDGVEPPSADLLDRLGIHAPNTGRYRFRAVIGRGGGGVVLKVWDTKLNRPLAMKVVLGRGEGRPSGDTPKVDGRTLSRFVDEARIASQLNHPGIVPVHELGADETGRAFFTMKLVRGENLATVFQHVRAGTDGWNQTRALGVLLRVCEAMAFAHDKGVIHRDLKPANIMVGRYGEVYVMDWGLARVVGEKDRRDLRICPEPKRDSVVDSVRRGQRHDQDASPLITVDGAAIGTPAYMSPEQARGDAESIDTRSDVYALGAMLYELVAGTPPYSTADAGLSPYTIVERVKEGPPPRVDHLVPRTPPELIAIIDKAMARRPDNRFATIELLAADLRAFLERRVVAAYEAGTWAETKKWIQRNRPLAASLASLLGLAFAGTFYVAAQNTDIKSANIALGTANTRLELALRRADETAAEANTQRQIALDRAAEVTAALERLEVAHNTLREAQRIAKENGDRALEQQRLASAKEAEASEARAGLASRDRELEDVNSQSETLERESRLRQLGHEVAKFERLGRDSTRSEQRALRSSAWWIERARHLVEGSPAQDGLNLPSQPGLQDVRSALAAVRLRARLNTPLELAQDMASNERIKRCESQRGELVWKLRLLGVEPADDQSVVESELDSESLPRGTESLNAISRALVGPDVPLIGLEVRGLVLAQRALAAANDRTKSMARDTLSWALFRCGRMDQAIAESRQAVAEAPVGQKDMRWISSRTLESCISEWNRELASSTRQELERSLRRQLADLEPERDACRVWRFSSDADSAWHAQLMEVEAGLVRISELLSHALLNPGDTVVPPSSLEDGWQDAIPAILSSDLYRGVHWPRGGPLTAQLGLVPIGPDPTTGYWEFSHTSTGAVAYRNADGSLALGADTGLVFVLLPGGFVPKEQREDSNQPSSRTELQLEPFFISKYEITEYQWKRIDCSDRPVNIDASKRMPAAGLTWIECQLALGHLGWLRLPSEAEWEYSCRAGSATRWFLGDEAPSMTDFANLETVRAQEVGMLQPNAFGLYDIQGNVSEWCGDFFDRAGELYVGHAHCLSGEVLFPNRVAIRVARGASFRHSAAEAQSSVRFGDNPDHRHENLGMRPARSVLP